MMRGYFYVRNQSNRIEHKQIGFDFHKPLVASYHNPNSRCPNHVKKNTTVTLRLGLFG